MEHLLDVCRSIHHRCVPEHFCLSHLEPMERGRTYVGRIFVPRCQLTNFLVYWSLISVVVISIVLLATSPKTDAEFVFTNFSNTTGWSDGTAWMLGLLQSALSFIG